MKAYFTFKLKDEQLNGLKEKFPDVTFGVIQGIDQADLADAEIIITYGEDIDEGVLDRAKSLKWLMVASAGVEKMPLEKIAERGIVMTNVRGIHKTPMAESVLAHILSLSRSLPDIYANQRNKKWEKKVRSKELSGSTAVILGPGAIGSEIGRLLQAFGVHTIGCSRSGKPVSSMDEVTSFDQLKGILPEADYVIAVLPSTKETKGLIGMEHFDVMKETAVFMNFGRGDLVLEKDIAGALKDGKIGHAVLDVFEEEPLPASSELWNLDNVTISPHVSSHSSNYVPRALEIFSENLKRWKAGEPELLNQVDPARGY